MNTYIITRPNHSSETGFARPSLHWPDCAAWAIEAGPGKWLAQTHSGFAAGCMPCNVCDSHDKAVAIAEADALASDPGPQHPSYWAYYGAAGGDPERRIMNSDDILEMLNGATWKKAGSDDLSQA